MKTKIIRNVSWMAVALLATGCASNSKNQLSTLQNELEQAQQQNTQLQSSIDQSSVDIKKLTDLNQQLKSSGSSSVTTVASSESSLLPPNAKTGECYARVLTPATYRTDSKEVIKKAAGYRIKVSQPVYEWATQSVLVKEASEVAELVPARYEWKTESVLVREAVDVLTTIPAVYETQSEKVLVKAAYTTWKKGRGPIERLNNSTGEIMCLIEVPAEYRIVTSKVVVTPARTESNSTPAVYKEVKKRIMVEGPTMVKRTIPAVYNDIKVRKVAQPAQKQRIDIPAVYQTVTNRIKVTDSFLEWRSILCETNTNGSIVRNLQRALSVAGHNPGSVDGILGAATLSAVKDYQRQKNLAVGQLTIETLKSLGVSY